MEHHLGFPPATLAVFIVLSLGALAVDLFSHRKDKPITLLNASLWSVFWIAVAMAFAAYLKFAHGTEMASLFVTGYALEKVLSVDNLFVFMAIFAWFKVPNEFRHRVLYWGIIGAIVFRMIFVAIGTSLLSFGPWVEIVFALIIAWTAVMMLKGGDDEEDDFSDHIAHKFVGKFFPSWPKYHGHDFIISREQAEASDSSNDALKKAGKYFATPLLLCLAVVEISDVLFAFDSVPAVIAVSKEPLIVYSAMMFAILGLRTMYFVLEALKGLLVHLEKAVIVLLFFIAVKLLLNATDHMLHHGLSISANASLAVVGVVLFIGIAASLIFPEKEENESTPAQ